MTTLPITQIRIQPDEYRARTAQLLEHIQTNGYSGVVLFDHHYVHYYSGFFFIPTERPVAFAMNAKGDRALFVPRLELEHARANAMIDRVEHYIEYPYIPHPMHTFRDMLHSMGIGADGLASVAADHDGYPWVFGYRGDPLSKLLALTQPLVPITAFIEDAMMIKSHAEIALIRESCKWGNLAHVLLQRYTKVGASETDVSNRATNESTYAMLDTLGPIYRAQSEYYAGATAGYRGQIGRNAAIPHALANNLTFQPGDVLVTGAAAAVWGYVSELERTMIMGAPNDDQRRMFDHMMALQEIAFEAMKPGDPCSQVDHAVRAYYEAHDLMDNWRHHTGHAIGIRYHEAPFLDVGDDTPMLPGMLFTVEPGLYAAHLGGFRHSDTVLITETGIELLTYYPRDLESLTLPL